MNQISQVHQKKLKKLQHLYWRAGFGLSPKAFQETQRNIATISINDEARQLIQKGKKSTALPNQPKPVKSRAEFRALSKAEMKQLKMEARQKVGEMNADWVRSMATTDNPLLERMSLFWHDHFACRITSSHLVVDYLNAIRQNALGNFKDLLIGVSKSAAMIRYLNNQQNKKQKPNENFARELIELFTIGRGNYTEKDVKEAARAFTGWSSDFSGEFVFRRYWHDGGAKTFMGQTGNWGGEDIIDILLSKKETALFLTRKLYRYFVNERIEGQISEQRVQQLANSFYKSNYDIAQLMQEIFTSQWFYADQHIGTKIKSPIDFLVGVMRTIQVEFEDKKPILFVEKALGQMLFNPPNVAGWAGGKAWIDNSTLMFRLNFVNILFGQVELEMHVKEEFTAQPRNKVVKKLVGKVSMEQLVQSFQNKKQAEIFNAMEMMLLQTSPSTPPSVLNSFTATQSSHSDYIKTLALRLMSMPEYQLC